ncbi:nucleoside triphosphate pyrophosphohydrolase [Bacillus salitolerans]|uniref:Nucleoside triphosphate pyrophosphohydrolase n=1 Tax=Bacillus salitolerans TaxID=1437434 RepID=A0ABW4LPI2_9BACI
MTNTIFVLGLGAGELGQLSLNMYNKIKSLPLLYVRTYDHPIISDLEKEGIRIHSFDSIYEQNDSFQAVYDEIVEILCDRAKESDLYYAVPGHPLVAEKTVQMLLEKRTDGLKVVIEGGSSFIDPMLTALEIDPIEGFQILDATSFQVKELQLEQHMIICQVYDQFVASDVKLSLMERLPDDYEVFVVTAAGTSIQEIKKVPLYELDHGMNVNNLTTLYIPPVKDEQLLYSQFYMLRKVIADLRGPNGCPWDKEQTHQSLKPYLLEEAYEVIEAIDEEDDDHLVEELGDVLLQVMLHAQIGEDEGWFSIDDIIKSITAKMIRRHPHVFGNVTANTAEDVVKNWDAIKKQEAKSEDDSILQSIPGSLPGLMLAYKLQKKAAKVGFDWTDVEPIWGKVYEEIEELKQEIAEKSPQERISKEFGDLLFALVNLGRFYGVEPEVAISETNSKFKKRFQYIEREVKRKGLKMENLPLEQLDQYWEEAKMKEGKGD